MYKKTARFYDLIYDDRRDAAADARAVQTLIERYAQSPTRSLLDVACGTGAHMPFFRDQFDEIEGIDLDPGMLTVARERFPEIQFHERDMVDFDLGRQFDVVTCMFSSIGYAGTVERLKQAIATMTRHLSPGGALIVEPWIKPEVWIEDHFDAIFIDEPDIKIARMTNGRRDENLAIMEFHYLIATQEGIEHLVEEHRAMMFTHQEYIDAFIDVGLETHHDSNLMPLGRGVYVGVKPLQQGEA